MIRSKGAAAWWLRRLMAAAAMKSMVRQAKPLCPQNLPTCCWELLLMSTDVNGARTVGLAAPATARTSVKARRSSSEGDANFGSYSRDRSMLSGLCVASKGESGRGSNRPKAMSEGLAARGQAWRGRYRAPGWRCGRACAFGAPSRPPAARKSRAVCESSVACRRATGPSRSRDESRCQDGPRICAANVIGGACARGSKLGAPTVPRGGLAKRHLPRVRARGKRTINCADCDKNEANA